MTELKLPPHGAYKLPIMNLPQLAAGDVEGTINLVFQMQFTDQELPLTIIHPISIMDATSLHQMLSMLQRDGLLPVIKNEKNGVKS